MEILRNNLDLDEFFRPTMGRKRLLMLDYDGTLAPLIKERMEAFPYPGVKEQLQALMNSDETRLVIVSGRSLEDLKHLLGIKKGIELWGSHGFERQLKNGEIKGEGLDSNKKEVLAKALAICLENLQKDEYETKPVSIAFHWRGMEVNRQKNLREKLEKSWLLLTQEADFEVHPFDGGIEFRPKGINKGNVVETLVNEMPTDSLIAYLGDDLTDEEAFEKLGNRGLKVLVRKEKRATLADLFLVPPKELLTFLTNWRGLDE